MSTQHTPLEIMLIHLLNQKAPNGKQWVAVTVPGIGRFTREDTERTLAELREQVFLDGRKRWWKLW
jgi:hypothetical protein